MQVLEKRTPIAEDRSDLILLLLYTPGATGELFEPVEGKQRLFYELFLIGKEAGLERFDGFYHLEAYADGGHSTEAEADLNFLASEKIVQETPDGLAISPKYQNAAKVLANRYSPEVIRGISRVKSRYNLMPQLTLFYYLFYRFFSLKPRESVQTPAR